MSIGYSGERITQDFTPKGLIQQHVAAYEFVKGHSQGRHVLDIGFGDGYGSAMLSEIARRVTAVDYSVESAKKARHTYVARTNLHFLAMDAQRLAFRAQAFDLVCASQLIEHLRDQRGFLQQVKALLKDNGIAIIITPNRYTSLFNPFHIHEFDPEEFRLLLEETFPAVTLQGVFASERVWDAMANRRKWAKRLLAMDVLRLRDRLPSKFVVSAYGLATRSIYSRIKHDSSEDEIETGDFWLASENLQSGLDLFAICQKSEG